MVQLAVQGASATDYVTALLGCEIDWANVASEKQDEASQETKKLHFAPQVCVELLQKASSIVPHIMPRKERTTASRLLHRCLRPEDIFVDEEFRIKTVIGCRGSWAGPAFAGQAPTAYDIGGHDMLNQPKEFLAQLKSEVSEEEFDRFSKQLLLRSREHKETTLSPIWSLIHVAIKIEEFGLLPLREFLIQAQRTWGHFDTQGVDAQDPCPYHFTDDEMREHAEEVEGLEKGDKEEVKQACLQAKRQGSHEHGGVGSVCRASRPRPRVVGHGRFFTGRFRLPAAEELHTYGTLLTIDQWNPDRIS
ncbi:hypothetical protein BKA80DRAFT_258208 [Phyllosticta citrichinensis]